MDTNRGCLCLVLHAHLPFVRHPEHEHSLEELWLYEAIGETYLPLLRVLDGWHRDGIPARITFTLTPTLCSMFNDALLRARCAAHLDNVAELAEKEVHRTTWESSFRDLARFYHMRLIDLREEYAGCRRDLLARFRACQDRGQIEVIGSSATHALLPLLMEHPASLHAQLHVASDYHRSCFGNEPQGIWLPECGYAPGLDRSLADVNARWFIVDTHGLLNANPIPRYGTFAPVLTPARMAAFGRDRDSARQVWSRDGGYPGDPRYRDFYRDIGFDLDLDYLRPHLAASNERGFTGIKYYRVTGGAGPKETYDRAAALRAVEDHADHFLSMRRQQLRRLESVLRRPPVVVCPYDAELFGHWWFEGPEFLDRFVRKAVAAGAFDLVTPGDFLKRHPLNQVATPAESSWGEEGYWRVWLNEKNEWIYRRLRMARRGMSRLAGVNRSPTPIEERALKQAGRELLLAEASDWPFILRAGTTVEYATRRVTGHLSVFETLRDQITAHSIDERALKQCEAVDNIFPRLDYRYWRAGE